MVTIVREQNENNEHLVQRFKKAVRAARFVVQMKRSRYHAKAKTKKRIREEAISRTKYRDKRRREALVS